MPGKGTLAGSILLLVLIVAAAGAQESGTLVRGNTFTVTVSGLPRTAYDVWVEGTSFMTGEPGDQPPVVVPGQVDVVQDPPDGPYTIGSTPISGGGTILGDVAPSTPLVPNTSYYALVTTGVEGYGTVLFQTSAATATRQFHVSAQNPANPDEQVGVMLGAPAPSPAPVLTMPLPTIMQTPVIPPETTTAPVTPVQTTPATMAVPPTAPSPPGTPAGTTPSEEIPLPAVTGVAAAGIALYLAGKER